MGMRQSTGEQRRDASDLIDLIHQRDVHALITPHAVICISVQTGGMMCLSPFPTAFDAAEFVRQEEARQSAGDPVPLTYVVVPVVETMEPAARFTTEVWATLLDAR